MVGAGRVTGGAAACWVAGRAGWAAGVATVASGATARGPGAVGLAGCGADGAAGVACVAVVGCVGCVAACVGASRLAGGAGAAGRETVDVVAVSVTGDAKSGSAVRIDGHWPDTRLAAPPEGVVDGSSLAERSIASARTPFTHSGSCAAAGVWLEEDGSVPGASLTIPCYPTAVVKPGTPQ